MKRFLRNIIRLVLIIAGFLFIFKLPSLLGIGKDHVVFNFETFWLGVRSDFQSLFRIKDAAYLSFFKQLNIAESYQYSITILFFSLIFIIFMGLVFAVLVILAPEKLRNSLKSGINFFEAVPDLLVIFLFQFFVIILYKKTGIKFLQLYGVFGAKPYFVPIITVSFLPLFLLIQFLIKVITDEQSQQYVLYAKAKGIGRLRTLLLHIMRNIFPLSVLQLRTIVWVLLSNIYLVEYLFNINGFTQQFFKIISMGGDFVSLVVCLLMFSIPLLVIEAAGWTISKLIRGKERVSI
ncbi:ABC transporter permease subunit [Paenibacillus sp. BSR1-1]|uniref:ABC transporter permease subunit n=1 Tax=Paenibacillus sp. BSR1-1 TaxID=3020845 RepID=UPI0025AF26D2|nr:ABC transporter permease subunit [Paenibacillus sp. BSR1-1]MDN3017053.1 ABC transporter permease subunit [Paenibacillus sp. BSR1-1]